MQQRQIVGPAAVQALRHFAGHSLECIKEMTGLNKQTVSGYVYMPFSSNPNFNKRYKKWEERSAGDQLMALLRAADAAKAPCTCNREFLRGKTMRKEPTELHKTIYALSAEKNKLLRRSKRLLGHGDLTPHTSKVNAEMWSEIHNLSVRMEKLRLSMQKNNK